MAHFDAAPAPVGELESAETVARNSVIGLRLFAIYVALYSVYMLLNAFLPDVMARELVWGQNVAIIYGFGLIFAAFVLALLYGWLCRVIRA